MTRQGKRTLPPHLMLHNHTQGAQFESVGFVAQPKQDLWRWLLGLLEPTKGSHHVRKRGSCISAMQEELVDELGHFLCGGRLILKSIRIKSCHINARPPDNNDETDRTIVVPELGPLLQGLWLGFSLKFQVGIHWLIRFWGIDAIIHAGSL